MIVEAGEHSHDARIVPGDQQKRTGSGGKREAKGVEVVSGGAHGHGDNRPPFMNIVYIMHVDEPESAELSENTDSEGVEEGTPRESDPPKPGH